MNETNKLIMNFIEKNIFSRFGFPRKFFTDNASAFKYSPMVDFCDKHIIIIARSNAYYP